MSDAPPSFQDILATAQRVQREMGRVQEELAKKNVEGSAGGGMVVAVANGRQQLVSLRIDPEIVDREEIAMLQDLVVAAVNQALGNAQALMQSEMSKLTGGLSLKIPGLTD